MRMTRRIWVLVLALVGCQLLLRAQSNSRNGSENVQQPGTMAQTREGTTGADWPFFGGTASAWRYSALNQINTTNVNKIVPVWMFQSGDEQGPLQSTPIVVNGIVYISTNRVHVFAIDGVTGKFIWQYIYEPSPAGGLSSNRGLAVADGKVFVGTGADFLVALDQKTGKEVWKSGC